MNDSILIRLLARTDAVWFPLRSWDRRPFPTVLYEHRRDFASGLPWSSGGASATERKRIERDLAALAEAGLVSISRQGERAAFVKLTDAADWYTRALCDLAGITETLALMAKLAALAARGYCAVSSGKASSLTVPEWALTPQREKLLNRPLTPKDRDALFTIEETFAPAVCRGWVRSVCTVRGACWYTLTDSGIEALCNPPTMPKDLPVPSEEKFRAYDHALTIAQRELRDAEPVNVREIGLMPCRDSQLARDVKAVRTGETLPT